MLKQIGFFSTLSAAGLFVLGLISSDGLASFGGTPSEPELGKKAGKSRFYAGRFHNLGGQEPEINRHGIGRFFQVAAKFYSRPKGKTEPGKNLPIDAITDQRFATPPEGGIRITWLGHASILVEIDGYRILTDPHFSDRASPFRWAGPKRFQPVPIAIDQLPTLDAVIISHDHYDHLDYDTIRKIAPKVKHFYTPLGVGSHLRSWGIEEDKITELDWWQEAKLDNSITFAPTPAQHFSGRGLFKRNKTLWASWVILGKQHRVYFSGDSGMFNGFKEIGERYGPFDYTLMHIGAYSDEWPTVHMTPEEAVQAHIDLRGRVFVPIHWGTFRLAFHDWSEPAERLYTEANKKHLQYVVPLAGQSFHNPNLPPVKTWWREVG